jgi:hypothetical protein
MEIKMKKVALMIFLTVFVFSCDNKEFKANYDSDSVNGTDESENGMELVFENIGNENVNPNSVKDFQTVCKSLCRKARSHCAKNRCK